MQIGREWKFWIKTLTPKMMQLAKHVALFPFICQQKKTPVVSQDLAPFPTFTATALLLMPNN